MILTGQNKPVLNGLVLAGGKSSRMGRDKAAMQWHGKEQHLYMVDLLRQFCAEVFVSRRQGQDEMQDNHYQVITDAYDGLGPYGAILSAFKKNNSCAWLVVACDLPLLDAATLEQLVVERDTTAMATTFQSPHDGLPEPLITIWEPKSHDILLASLSKSYQCPRKALINNPVKIIRAKNENALMNVNTPQDVEKAQQIISTNKILANAK